MYRSPLAASGLLSAGDWVHDDLPDLLWPVLALSELGTVGAQRFIRWQKAAQEDLAGMAEPGLVAGCLDGRLTSMDRLAAQVPEAKGITKTRAVEHGLLPDPVTGALASYSALPARWLLDREDATPGQEELDLLARAILDVLSDGHREAVIKCLWIWSAVQAGTFSADTDLIGLLQPYPNNPATRAAADSAIRAAWGARHRLTADASPRSLEESHEWARAFWDTNSMTTRCARSREAVADRQDGVVSTASTPSDAAPDETTPPDGVAPATNAMPEDGAHLRDLAADLLASYIEALENSPAKLYDHAPKEVHSGLVARVGRDVITALGAPDLWCLEHGAHINRALVEVRVYLGWMAQQDSSIYRTFQEYGAGKAKLYSRILDEVPEEARGPEFAEAIRDLATLSHNDEVTDHRAVDTRDSFAGGKSIRDMADECGLLDLYRQAYYMASGVAHSEWWSIETHVMELCLNVLHGGHLIPSLSLNSGGNVGIARAWIDRLYELIQFSMRTLGTDGHAVVSAFAWLAGALTGPEGEAGSTSGPPPGN